MYIIPQLKGEEKLIYLRKSQTDDPLLSVEEVLANHEQRLDEWNERHQPDGGRVPEINRYREVVSGETISGRPKMTESSLQKSTQSSVLSRPDFPVVASRI